VEVLTMKELLETGVHFGHRTRKWNPKMARYIFTERKGIHIIDLEQTVDLFKKAYFHVRDRVGADGEILFVGTKKQVQSTIVEEAQRCGAHYVNRRWLGGTLTNFGTIKQSIERMKKLEATIEDGTVDHMPNKEASRLRRELAKLQRNLNGLRHLQRKPDLLYVIDPDVEANAVHEANLVGIPVIAIVDTNCDPDPIDFLIPGNDDAIKATKLITARIADAVLEGREGRQDTEEASAEETKTISDTEEAAESAEETDTINDAEEAAESAEEADTVDDTEQAAEPADEEPAKDAASNKEDAPDEEPVEDNDEPGDEGEEADEETEEEPQDEKDDDDD